jgi:HAD superfamily hydrolase (TIGR01509 family)
MIKNILWDLDGTIFDTYPAITYAISKSLNEMGFSLALNVIDGLARQSIDHCMETLSQRFKLDPDLLGAQFVKSYREISPAKQIPFPGVREVCTWIHQHDGLNVIVTHRRVQSTQKLLDFHKLSSCFDDILSSEQGYPLKPDPAMILIVLEKYHLRPAETIFIGDRELDIQAGRAAGVRTCLFGNLEIPTPVDIMINNYDHLLTKLANDHDVNRAPK